MPHSPQPTTKAQIKPTLTPEDRRQNSNQRGYTYRWSKESRLFLQLNPLCVECLKQGKTQRSEVVDHVVPHKGDMDLFWNSCNWQALCKTCHDRKTALHDGGFGRSHDEIC